MGDKQDLLRDAVPELVARLVTPFCIPKNDPEAPAVPSSSGGCAPGYIFEIAPIVDLHVGIVSSSLGGGGAPDTCPADEKNPIPQLSKFSRHNDDRGQLLNRVRPDPKNPPGSGIEATVPNAVPKDSFGGNFLAWLPEAPANVGKPAPNVPREPDLPALQKDFQTLVGGVQEYGCGLEAQLES